MLTLRVIKVMPIKATSATNIYIHLEWSKFRALITNGLNDVGYRNSFIAGGNRIKIIASLENSVPISSQYQQFHDHETLKSSSLILEEIKGPEKLFSHKNLGNKCS